MVSVFFLSKHTGTIAIISSGRADFYLRPLVYHTAKLKEAVSKEQSVYLDL